MSGTPPHTQLTPPLTLRVMRLCFPKTSSSCWNPIDELIHHGLTSPHTENDLTQALYDDCRPTEEMALQLPTQQGKIFVGETFKAYINVVNSSTDTCVYNVKLRLQFTTPSGNWTLYDGDPVATVRSQETYDVTVSHPVDSAGIHVLSCELTYTTAETGSRSHGGPATPTESTTMKRTYRFPVLDPFRVTYRTAELLNGNILVECQCTNTTDLSLYVESVSFTDVPAGFRVEEGVPLPPESPPTVTMSQRIRSMRRFDVLSFVYTLIRLPSCPWTAQAASTTLFGTLKLQWRVPMGGVGVTQLPLMSKTGSGAADSDRLDVLVRACPVSIKAETPFYITLECLNRSSDVIAPVVSLPFAASEDILFQGETQRALGPLCPGNAVTFQLPLIALRPGFVYVQGISIRDAKAGCDLYTSGVLASILVV